MKIYKILFPFLTLLVLISCKINKEETKEVPSTITSYDLEPKDDSKLTYIGTLFDVEHVNEEKKILIDDNNRELIESSTREIIKDNDKEYYIADINHPILKSKTLIYNDISSFIKIILFLEKEANYYLKDSTNEEKNNEILSYIRTTNIEYDTSLWSVVCGESNKLRDYLKDQHTGGLEPSEYFASFLNKNLFNIDAYPNTKEEYINQLLFLLDPIKEEPIIDLVHFIGALDGTCINTGHKLNTFPYAILKERYYQMVVSWAGDLQTCAASLEKYDLLNISFEDILKREELTFDMPDLLADMDATNIGLNLDLTEINNLSDIFINYYSEIIQNNNRKSKFILSVSKQSGYVKKNIEDNFIYITKEMLKLDKNYNDYSSGNYYEDYGKYYYLQNNDEICDISYRRHLAEEFINYFINKN